jgi:hypothetical protein
MPETDTLTIQRQARYRFYSHEHPYVGELVKRLLEGSVRKLQATDTEYPSNSDGTLKPTPNSTVALTTTETALVDDPENRLPKGTPVILFDSTGISLSNGRKAVVPGSIEWEGSRGLRLNVNAVNPGDALAWQGTWSVNWHTRSGPSSTWSWSKRGIASRADTWILWGGSRERRRAISWMATGDSRAALDAFGL